MDNTYEIADRETKAELDALSTITNLNSSDNLKGTVSIQKIASNWRTFKKQADTVLFEYLYNVDSIVSKFIEWWGHKDKNIASIQNCPLLLHDVTDYIMRQILIHKIKTGRFINPQVRVAAYTWYAIKNMRTFCHEAVSRSNKLTGNENDTKKIEIDDIIHVLENKYLKPTISSIIENSSLDFTPIGYEED